MRNSNTSRQPPLSRNPSQPRRGARAAGLFGMIVILLTFGGIGAWASLAPLASAVVTQGQLVVSGNRKKVQHRDGGIVGRLDVRDGDDVVRGQLLIRLNDTELLSESGQLEETISGTGEQIALVSEEYESVTELFKAGYAAKTRYLALKRKLAELKSERRKAELRLAAVRVLIARSEIRAPAAGTVVGLQVHTLGGVIKGGETILEIVPGSDPLLVEARIDPADIDDIALGLETEVRFTGFKQRTTPTLKGEVVNLSADVLTDKISGESYYRAWVRIGERELARINGRALQPGMPAEVLITTGSRTVLAYLLQPLLDSTNRALREK